MLETIRDKCSFVLHRKAQNFILGVIIFNAVVLGLMTKRDWPAGLYATLELLDHIALWIFVVELVLKHLVLGLKFWKDPWSVFDFLVVAVAFVPSGGSLSVLRTLRILRVLRLVSSIRPLRLIVTAIIASVPSIGWLSALVLIVFYVFSVIGTMIFGQAFPEFFGTLGNSAYTLFQIMTLESWSMGVARPVMAQFEYAYIFFVMFILCSTFVMMNLFVAIIINSMQSATEAVSASGTEAGADKTDAGDPTGSQADSNAGHAGDVSEGSEVQQLRAEIERLKSDLDRLSALAAKIR